MEDLAWHHRARAESEADRWLRSRHTAGIGWPVLRLLELPSFSTPTAWEICKARGGTQLVRRRWQRDADLAHFDLARRMGYSPYPFAPTYESHRLPAAVPADLDALVSSLRAIRVPLGQPDPAERIGILDGTVYELSVTSHAVGSIESRLVWNTDVPDCWPDVAAWMTRATRLFDAAAAATGELVPAALPQPTSDAEAVRAAARDAFRAKRYSESAEHLATLARRQVLTPVDALMFEQAVARITRV